MTASIKNQTVQAHPAKTSLTHRNWIIWMMVSLLFRHTIKFNNYVAKSLFLESRRNHRLNQNRISAMKCRQKKKQQFSELLNKKEELEANNLELKEKVSQSY